MAKLDPKKVQSELKEGLLWPVYWICGPESMKARELTKRIRSTALGDGPGGVFAEEILDASETSTQSIIDAASSFAMGGGPRVIIVRDAHCIKDAEALEPLMGPKAKREALVSVCIFLSKDLDKRKKSSKMLLEKAAVVTCDEVLEGDREAWIQYLAKQRGMEPSPEAVATLMAIMPWSLDAIDNELFKLSVATGVLERPEDVLQGAGTESQTDRFLDAFLSRDRAPALASLDSFARHTEESLPLLGLLAWNVRQLIVFQADELKMNPYLAQRLSRYAPKWTSQDLESIQEKLAELDFDLKQTPKLPIAAWHSLIT